MKVHHVMSLHLVTVSPEAKLIQAWQLLNEQHVNALPVVDNKKKLVGILTKEDILKQLFPEMGEFVDDFFGEADFERMEEKLREKKHVPAREVMNKRVIFTRLDTPIMRALSRMIVRSVNQLPVLSEKDEVVGMVTKGDVFYALFRKQSQAQAAVDRHGSISKKTAERARKPKKRK